MRHRLGLALVLIGLWAVGCVPFGPGAKVETLKTYPLDSVKGIIDSKAVTFDPGTSSDGKGSLKILSNGERTVRIIEAGDLDVEDCKLIYQAKIKSDDLTGQAFLEMWVRIPGKGEFFSRGLQSPLSGTSDWRTVSTPFFLQKGQNPDEIKLNLVVNGTGVVWIDDIKLMKGPLK